MTESMMSAMRTGFEDVQSPPSNSTTVISDPRYARLFEPVTIGPVVAANRFWAAPYSTGWRMDQLDEEIAHRKLRAEGGWAVVNTGEVIFDAHSRSTVIDGLELMNDRDGRMFTALADAVHEHGALAALELVHMGDGADPRLDRIPALAPSQMQSDSMFFSQAIPKTMELSDIRRVQRDWIEAARRGRDAGFDIVDIHAAHGYLPVQFLTQYHNRRTDGYGGSLANRARFLLEILEGVRDAVGDDMAIAVRFAIDGVGNGIPSTEEALEVVSMADHLVDVWDIAQGGMGDTHRDLTPSRLFPEGHSLESIRRIRDVTAKPVVGTARFTDPDLMVSAIASGTLDFIGAARPSIAEPFFPRKVAAGQFARIRECIGSNHCARSQVVGNVGCSQNPTVGGEGRKGWHPENLPLPPTEAPSVLVVGAGPAGLEAATTLARRGFDMVHVIDSGPAPGGYMRWFRQLPGFAPWGRVIEHREALLREYPGATFIPDTRLSVDDVLEYGAEVVIVATGAPWATVGVSFYDNEPIPGADASLPHVATAEQLILEKKQLPGTTTLVYDCEGDVTAIAVAQWLQQLGRTVQIVTPFGEVAGKASQDFVGPALRIEVLQAGGTLTPGTMLLEVGNDSVVLGREDGVARTEAVDSVVLVTRRTSATDLYDQLAALGEEQLRENGISALHRVGDCVAPTSIADAIFDGHRLARSLGVDGNTPKSMKGNR